MDVFSCCSLFVNVANVLEYTSFIMCICGASCEGRVFHLVPHYLSTYVPLCLVMIVNPVLYSKTTTAGIQFLQYHKYLPFAVP